MSTDENKVAKSDNPEHEFIDNGNVRYARHFFDRTGGGDPSNTKRPGKGTPPAKPADTTPAVSDKPSEPVATSPDTTSDQEPESEERRGGGSGGGGNTTGGGFDGWWKRQGTMTKIAVHVTLLAIVIIVANGVMVYTGEWLDTAQNEKIVADAKAKAKEAEILRSVKPSPTTIQHTAVQEPEIVRAYMFDCADISVMMQNFALFSDKPQETSPGKVLNFIPGCAWSKFDYPVTSLRGENYLIAFDVPYDDHLFEKCGRIEPNNNPSGVCMDLVNSHLRTKFRVIIGAGGYLKIGG